MKLILDIFWSFMKIGPVTFGGGYAMISLIEREVIERRKWMNEEEVTDIFAVAESIPGAIAINSATFIGFKLAGIRGAIAAMAGIMFPTFLIVIALSIGYLYFQGNHKMEAAFEGIRPAIVALIIYAAYKIGKTAVLDWTTMVIVAATVVAMLTLHPHPVLIIIGGGALGIVLVAIKQKLGIKVLLQKAKINNDTGRQPDYFIGDGI